MDYAIASWMLLDLAAALLAVSMAGLVILYRPPAPLWPSLFFMMLGASFWAIGELCAQFFVDSPGEHWFWVQVLYLGIFIQVPSCLLFSLGFAEYFKLKLPFDGKLLRGLIVLVAIGHGLALLTNPWHGQFITPHIDARNEFHTFWYLQAANHYLYLMFSTMIFIYLIARIKTAAVRRQLLVMLCASLMPLLINSLYILEAYPLKYDLTVVTVALVSLIFFLSVYRSHLFSLSPFLLQKFIENEVDPFLVLNTSGRLLACSPQAIKLFGKHDLYLAPNGIAILEDVLEVASGNPRDIDKSKLQVFDDCLSQPAVTMTVRTPKKPNAWYRLTSNLIKTSRGKPKSINIRLREITAMVVRHQTNIRQSAMLEGILSSTDQGIVVVDEAFKISYCNDRFIAIFNLPPEMLGRTGGQALYRHIEAQLDDAEPLKKTFSPAALASPEKRNEILRLKTGVFIETYSNAFPIMDGAVGRIWVIQDVTQRISDEIRRKEVEASLLENKRLESLGIMAGGVAHDFNNILTAILGRASLILLQDGIDASVHEDASLIQKAALQAAELTEQILSFAGQVELALMPLDLRHFVLQTLDVVKHTSSPQISFDLIPGPSPIVAGDVAQLRQVVMNVLINGAEAIGGKPGGVQVTIDTLHFDAETAPEFINEQHIEAGNYAVVKISDNGTGISEVDLSSMFDPFYTTKFTGRGLGLAASLGIIRSHKGALAVDTELGKGSCFSIYLPLTLPSAIDLAEMANVNKADFDSELILQSEEADDFKVLAVDDEPYVLALLETIIRRGGYHVAGVASGEEAIEIYRESASDIDVVVLDLTMPGIDGAETYQALQKINPNVAVIIISGHAEIEVKRRLAGLGIIDILNKPFGPSELLALIKKVRSN